MVMDMLENTTNGSRSGSSSSGSGGSSSTPGSSVVASLPAVSDPSVNMPSAPIAVQQPSNVSSAVDYSRVHQPPNSPPPFTLANQPGGVPVSITSMINSQGVNGLTAAQLQNAGVHSKVMNTPSANLHAQFMGGGDPLDPKNMAVLNSMLSPVGGMQGMPVNYNDATEVNKMFIGGLSWNTNDSMLYHHFSKFGEVVEHCVMRDAATGRSRGFGFVKFANPDAVERVLAHSQHVIDEKAVDPKRAVPKYQSKLINKTKKVFLGGLPPDTTNEDVQMHFSRFGEVEEVMLMYDRTTHRLRGFGFVKFALEESAEAACREHYHEIKGKMVEAKKAQPKEAMTNTQLKKWSYGPVPMGTQPADPSMPYYLNGQRNPMFGNGAMTNPFSNGFPQFPYSPVLNYAGSPTFQVGSPFSSGGHLGGERTGTPTHFLFGDLMSSPFNGQLPTRTTTMSPSPLDNFTRENFLSSLPYMGTGSPRGAGGVTSPPLAAGLDTSHDFAAGILATSPQNTGFHFGSPFGFSTVPPAMVAAYQGYSNQ